MTNRSLARSARPHPAAAGEDRHGDLEHVGSIIPRALPKLSGRLARGIALAEARFEEITRAAPYIWSVPSCAGEHAYNVNLKHGGCTCPDHPPKGERCKHEHAARYVKAKTAPCASCRRRFRFRDLFPVPDDHLTFEEHEELCRECAGAHGVL